VGPLAKETINADIVLFAASGTLRYDRSSLPSALTNHQYTHDDFTPRHISARIGLMQETIQTMIAHYLATSRKHLSLIADHNHFTIILDLLEN
jgi:hypothetical protein